MLFLTSLKIFFRFLGRGTDAPLRVGGGVSCLLYSHDVGTTMLAPAKINLFLHVAAPDANGYHPLQTLVAFADIGDEVELFQVGSIGYAADLNPRLSVDGPFAAELSTGDDNLVLRAAKAFQTQAGITIDRDIRLTKTLPIASGLGGGSADAGATLKLLRDAYAPAMEDSVLEDLAGKLGADGIMCLRATPALAEGYGERLTPVSLPRVSCVLVNPGVACATPAVYRGLDDLAVFSDIQAMQGLREAATLDQLLTILAATRNDLEPAAIALRPIIADVLKALHDQPETAFARMSGSGATCFALCRTPEAAEALGGRMQTVLPHAWVKVGRLG